MHMCNRSACLDRTTENIKMALLEPTRPTTVLYRRLSTGKLEGRREIRVSTAENAELHMGNV